MTELLTTRDMARFVARGYLELPAIIPEDVGERYVRDVERQRIPAIAAGTPLSEAYPETTAIHEMLSHPTVAGVIASLVGPDPLVDHHAMHLTLSPADMANLGYRRPADSQHYHQDSTIDTRVAFDLQLMWFPHEVTAEMGGTRFLPGSHLRIVSEAAVGRYQNIVGQRHVVCPAGTVLALHHGIWHGAGANRADRSRHMFKVRLNPQVPQVRLWDMSDLTPDDYRQKPIFHETQARPDDDLHTILCEMQPWYEADTGRLELLNRIRLWRHLIGDAHFDADYWLTRIENQPERRVESTTGT